MPPNKSLSLPPDASVTTLAKATAAPDTWRKLAKPLDVKMSKNYLGYTALEWTVAVLILLLLTAFFARIFFGVEIREFESQFFESIGLGGSRKYGLVAPLVAWWGYRLYSRESKKAKAASAPVVRPAVAISASLALVLALVLLVLGAR